MADLPTQGVALGFTIAGLQPGRLRPDVQVDIAVVLFFGAVVAGPTAWEYLAQGNALGDGHPFGFRCGLKGCDIPREVK